MRLLERESVLAALTEYAADARAGDGRVVLIGGEAGVGKTALLGALGEHEPEARWLWGACEGSFTPRPLGPVYDVASQLGGALARVCEEDAQRHRIFRALLDGLLASTGLTVLVIEDLHWADEATLDLLGFLAPRLRAAPVLLLVTYRNDGLTADDPLRIALGELGTQGSTRRVDLPPLSRGAVAALASQNGVGADELFSLTGGNPFLVTEVLDAGGHEVPPSAREAVLARVARLSPPARVVLEVAAVIGSRVEVGLLRQASHGSEEAIDGCLTAGALLSDGDAFRFRHAIARRAVEDALPAHRRAELHRCVLDLLVQRGSEDVARLAHHAEMAGDARAVLEFAPIAARHAASLGAHVEAAAQYKRAAKFADDKRTRASLLSALGNEYSLTDHWHDAEAVQQESLTLWREIGDQLQVGDTLRRMIRTMWRLCRGGEVIATAEAAVAALEALPESVELGWAYSELGMFRCVDNDSGVDLLWQAREIAERHGDLSLLAHVVNSIGCTKGGLEGVPDLRHALEIALAAGDDAEAGRAFTNLQSTLANECHLAEAEQVFREGMSYCEDHDIGTYEHCLRGAQGEVLTRLGRWDDADAMLTFDLEERALSPVNKISKLVVKGTLDARRGRATAAGTLDEALAYAEAGFESAYILEAGVARLEAAWLSGDADGIRREAERSIPVATTHDPWYAGALAAWLRRCGLPDADVGPIAPPYAALLAGDWRSAADQWHQFGCPYEQALALLDSGDADAMLQAVRIFERLGATATVARAQAVMRRHGVASIPRGARADTRANRFGLTRREQEVLDLVCEGLTNAEIGARLFIAEKTVDNHVSSLLAKMDVSSRREAARLATEPEQPEPAAV